MQLYLDCDGVLANFDDGATKILGMAPRRFEEVHGTQEFWKRLTAVPDLFNTFEAMHDAHVLYDAVKHLDPIILTGVPHSMAEAPAQKKKWIDRLFGSHQRVICCKSKDKSKYCKPGDVIVDDWPMYRHLWEAKGGIWIHHDSAEKSIAILKKRGII